MGRTCLMWVCAATIIAAPVLSVHADSITDDVRQDEAKQADIKAQTQKAADELAALVDKFGRSGIGGDDAQVLTGIQKVLGQLSDHDMAKVIDLLKSARSAANPDQERAGLRGAYVDQASIIVQLRQLLLEYQRQQELYELSLRFALLGDRQNANLKADKELIRSVANRGMQIQNFDENQRGSLNMQQADQGALRDETTALLGKLADLQKEATGAMADRLARSLDAAKDGRLEESLSGAADNLGSVALMLAATNERQARDQFYALALLTAPDDDPRKKIEWGIRELEKQIQAQTEVVTGTGQLKGNDIRDRAAALESKQADVVDASDRIRKEIDPVAPLPANTLAGAIENMQQARQSLNDQHPNAMSAAKNAQTALEGLEAAKQALEDKLASLNQDKPHGDALAQAQELKQQVEQLKADQENLAVATATPGAKVPELSPQQAQLEQRAGDLQTQAAMKTMDEAAHQIGEAAKDMEGAHGIMDHNKAADANALQKSAERHLDDAAAALEKKIAELTQDKNTLAKLDEARQNIADLIKQEQQVQLNTGQAAAHQEPNAQPPATQPQNAEAAAPQEGAPHQNEPPQNQPHAGQEQAHPAAQEQPHAGESPQHVAEQQQQVAAKTQETQANLPPEAEPAQAPLNEARQNMAEAHQQLQNAEPNAAQPPEQEATKNLNRAKKALDQQIAELQQKLGEQPENKPPDLAAELAKAQEDLNKAMQEDLQPHPHDPIEELKQRQQEIVQQLEQKEREGNHSPHLATAHAAARQAEEELNQHHLPQAVEAMKQAEHEMAQIPEEPHEPHEGEPHAPHEGEPHEAEAHAPHEGEPHAPHEGEPHEAEAHAPHEGEPHEGEPHAPHEGEPHEAEAHAPHEGEPHEGAPHEGEPHEAEAHAPHEGEPHEGAPHEGAPHEGEPHQAEAHQGEPHEGEPHEGAPHEGEPHEAEAHQGAPHEGAPHEGAPHEGAPHQGEPHEASAHAGSPHEGAPHEGAPHEGAPEQGEPGMPQLAQEQQALRQQAEQMAAAQQQTEQQQQQQQQQEEQQAAQQQPMEQPQMQQAAQDLGHVANEVAAAHAEDQGQLPEQAQQAMEQAQQQLDQAAQQAEAANPEQAQALAQQAQQSLAQAQAELAMAQQEEPGEPGQPHPGSPHPGSPHSGAPHPGSHSGPPHPGPPEMSQSPTPHKGDENKMSQAQGHRQGIANNTVDNGARADETGASAYLSLPARDRAAIEESHKDKYPEEYGPMIEQYLKNLSDQQVQPADR